MTQKKDDTNNTENAAPSTPATETPQAHSAAEAAPLATEAAPTEPTTEAPAGDAPATEASAAPQETKPVEPLAEAITVTLDGAVKGNYTGPSGKPLREMFPELAKKNYQVRNAGKIVSQVEPWMLGSQTLKTTQHATHG